MKRLIVVFYTILLSSLSLFAQSRDDEVVIETCTDVYEFKLNKGNVVVKNKISTQYAALREYDCKIQPSIFYGDNIKFDKSSCSKSNKPEHKSVTPDNVFYDDSKACFYNVTLNRKNKKCEASFERTFTDVHYFTHVPLADEFFIRSKTVKFIIPDEVGDFKLVLKNPSHNISGDQQRDGNKNIITYTITNMPAMKSEKNMPSAASVYPVILIDGAYKDIDDLYHWSRDLAEVDTSIPSLNSILDQISAQSSSDLDKIKNTYAWVQNNIRYVAFEAGISSHKPDTPAEVIRKRYGDCKGLALLLKTLLVAQGIDARLVYLGTKDIGCHISEVPSLASMNHVICAVFIDGRTYYLDATNNYIPVSHIPDDIQGVEALLENGASYKMVTLPTQPFESSCDSLHVSLSIVDDTLQGSAERWVKGDMKELLLSAYHEGEMRERSSFTSRALNDNSHSLKVNNAQWQQTSSDKDWAYLQGEIVDENSLSSLDDEIYIELDPDNMTQAIIDTTKREHNYVFPIRYRRVNEVCFTIPSGYRVEKLPSPININTPVGKLSCTFAQKGNTVVYVKTMDIARTELQRGQIATWNNNVRKWNEVCHEQLVLKPIK
jgi:hypothetical protein